MHYRDYVKRLFFTRLELYQVARDHIRFAAGAIWCDLVQLLVLLVLQSGADTKLILYRRNRARERSQIIFLADAGVYIYT